MCDFQRRGGTIVGLSVCNVRMAEIAPGASNIGLRVVERTSEWKGRAPPKEGEPADDRLRD